MNPAPGNAPGATLKAKMAANINLKLIIEKEQQNLTKHLSIMDYSKTDEQLKHITEGLKDLDPDRNAFIAMRINTENKEVTLNVTGNYGNAAKMVAINMQEHEGFRKVIFQALSEYGFMKLANKHTEEDCKKCKEPECAIRKADYKGE